MNNESVQHTSTIGIIGGGKIGLQLFELFSHSSLTQVAYVVDIDPAAPAIMAARHARVPTFKNLDDALASKSVNFVLEVTGSEKVAAILEEKLQNSATQVITHEMAYVIIRVIEENNCAIKDEVVTDISAVHRQIAESAVNSDRLLDEIESMTSNLRLLSLNARIEAARIGDAGKGFAVVAQEMQKFSDSVKNLTQEMEQLNNNVRTIAGSIEQSLSKLDKTEIG
jgi:methyl-accepting chemotaxis protein